jgi:hypothetical protein
VPGPATWAPLQANIPRKLRMIAVGAAKGFMADDPES